MTRRLHALIVPVLLAVCLVAPAAFADAVQTRILEDVSVEPEGEGWNVTVAFQVPVRVVRHTPSVKGEEVLVFVELLAVSPQDLGAARRRESLRIPAGGRGFLRSVVFDGERPEGPILEVRFDRSLAFQVRTGRDLRSLALRVEPVRPAAAPGASTAERHMEAARSAIVAGDLDLAVSYLTAVVAAPENPHSQEALELLGVAREKNGQLAHAKAEYERYLERYPEGEGAERVRQRLRAMLTARARPRETGRPADRTRAWERALDLGLDGSVSATYQRAAQVTSLEGERVTRSALYSDVHLDGRLRGESWSLRSRFSGRFGEDFLEGRETRVSSLFVQHADRRHGIETTVGRQSRSSGGVLGRFDGGHVAVELPLGFRLQGTAGLAVDSSDDFSFEPDRHFYGVSLDLPRWHESVDTQLFVIRQMVAGMTDRFAVGSELRYVGPAGFAALFLDYDLHFEDLNTAYLVANWRATDRLQLNLLADHRTSPILLTRSALSGQLVGGLADLRSLYDEDEIREIARDRTGRITTLTLGGTYGLSDRFQLATDLSATRASGTAASAGVPAIEGSGWELTPSLRLMGSDLLLPGDLTVATFLYRHDRFAETVTGSLLGRVPVFGNARIGPAVRVDYRMAHETPDLLIVRPLLRLDYRFVRFTVDTEVGMEWSRVQGGVGPEEDLGYHMTFTVRRDF